MLKADKRSMERHKSRYGHFGSGSCHTRQASDAEIRRHLQKSRNTLTKQRGSRQANRPKI